MADDVQSQASPLVADLVRDPIDDDQVERIRAGVSKKRQASAGGRRRGFLPLAAAAALLVALGAGIALWFSRQSNDGQNALQGGPLRLAGGGAFDRAFAASDSAGASSLQLDDGSTIEVSPGTEGVVTKNTARALHLRLEMGRATFSVTPGGPRRWVVDAGQVSVEVVGTVFTVDRSERRVDVSVERGRVAVRSELLERGVEELTAGQSLAVILDDEGREPRTPATATEVVEGGADGGDGGLPGTARPSRVDGGASPSAERSEWQRLAGEGDFEGAYSRLGASGLRRQTGQARTIAQLMTLADVARRSGHPREAVEPLEQALVRFPGDSRAAVAAFTLGRLESDVLRRHGRAARAFRRCLQLGAPGALHENASARLAESYAREGDMEAARQAAREYLRRYPEGRRADALRRWVEPR